MVILIARVAATANLKETIGLFADIRDANYANVGPNATMGFPRWTPAMM
jgi:hypothetical protein